MRKILLSLVIAVVVVALSARGGFVYWFFSGDGLRLAIEQQATAWLGQPVTVGRARAGIFPRTAIHLGDVRIGEPARVTLGRRGRLDGLPRAALAPHPGRRHHDLQQPHRDAAAVHDSRRRATPARLQTRPAASRAARSRSSRFARSPSTTSSSSAAARKCASRPSPRSPAIV